MLVPEAVQPLVKSGYQQSSWGFNELTFYCTCPQRVYYLSSALSYCSSIVFLFIPTWHAQVWNTFSLVSSIKTHWLQYPDPSEVVLPISLQLTGPSSHFDASASAYSHLAPIARTIQHFVDTIPLEKDKTIDLHFSVLKCLYSHFTLLHLLLVMLVRPP